MFKLYLLLLLTSLNVISQTKFTSTKYNYSFIIPDGWHVKDKIFNPDVDAKIVDGRGNSFIISVKTFPTATQLTAKQQMESTTNQEMEEQFNAVYGTAKVIKRGTVFVGLKECYYIHLLTSFQDGLQLYHKQFMYSEGYRILSIDACSIETYLDETTPAFAIMIETFKFSNLKNKGK
nr:hypothetical protein [uncultured Flavobacterium sp.]